MADYYAAAWIAIGFTALMWVVHWRLAGAFLMATDLDQDKDHFAKCFFVTIPWLLAGVSILTGMFLEFSQDASGDMVVDGLIPGEIVTKALAASSVPIAIGLLFTCLAGYRLRHPVRNYSQELEEEHPFTP